MHEVQLRDAKAGLSALVEKAANGEAAVITRRGRAPGRHPGGRRVGSFAARALLRASAGFGAAGKHGSPAARRDAVARHRALGAAHLSGGHQRAVRWRSGAARTDGRAGPVDGGALARPVPVDGDGGRTDRRHRQIETGRFRFQGGPSRRVAGGRSPPVWRAGPAVRCPGGAPGGATDGQGARRRPHAPASPTSQSPPRPRAAA